MFYRSFLVISLKVLYKFAVTFRWKETASLVECGLCLCLNACTRVSGRCTCVSLTCRWETTGCKTNYSLLPSLAPHASSCILSGGSDSPLHWLVLNCASVGKGFGVEEEDKEEWNKRKKYNRKKERKSADITLWK